MVWEKIKLNKILCLFVYSIYKHTVLLVFLSSSGPHGYSLQYCFVTYTKSVSVSTLISPNLSLHVSRVTSRKITYCVKKNVNTVQV